MSKYWLKFRGLAVAAAILVPASLLAQKEENTEKKVAQQIIITTKGDKNEKIVVEINGEKVTVNGKPLEEYKDKNGDINVRLNRLRDLESLTYFRAPRTGGTWNFNDNNGLSFFSTDENRAMLGVTTEKSTEGAKVEEITKGSAAEKAGLKENDIITRINEEKITSPDDLSSAIKKQKPGDKVTITYLRDKKENKTTAELSKWKGLSSFSLGDMNFDFDKIVPPTPPKVAVPRTRTWTYSGATPRLGLSVQDTDDGKGVKVIKVEKESNAAKAGIKEEDVITHLDDKTVNNVDEISELLKEKKDNPTVRFQLTRKGQSQNIEVSMPKKIKITDL